MTTVVEVVLIVVVPVRVLGVLLLLLEQNVKFNISSSVIKLYLLTWLRPILILLLLIMPHQHVVVNVNVLNGTSRCSEGSEFIIFFGTFHLNGFTFVLRNKNLRLTLHDSFVAAHLSMFV